MSQRIRHTRVHACGVCGGFDGQPRGKGVRCHGFTTADGRFAHCSREDHAGRLSPNRAGLFVHFLAGCCKCESPHTNGSAAALRTPEPRVVRETGYRIVDDRGRLIAVHVRRDLEDGDKRFYWERPDGQTGLGGHPVVSLPLYNLPALLAAARDAPVILTEGEKSCDALKAAGILAVATVTGARSTPQDDVLRPLLGHLIYIWPDLDDEGQTHMGRIAAALIRLGATPRVVAWPGAQEKGDDAADFLARGGTAGGIRALLEAASVWRPVDVPTAAILPDAEIGEHLTDLGNALRFLRLRGKELRYIGPWRKWLLWDGQRWEEDPGCKVLRHFDLVIKELIEIEARLRTEAAAIKTEILGAVGPPILSGGSEETAEKSEEARKLADQSRAFRNWARASEARTRIEAAVALARSRPEVEVRHDQLDGDPWALNVSNGTIDLRTGKLRAHRREDLITKLCPIVFDAKAEAPMWVRFLLEVMDGRTHVVEYLRRVLGYAVTAHVREQALFFLHGGGANGKSTLLGAIRDTLGPDYAIEAMPELLMEKKGEAHPTERAQLFGKRFVSTVEVSDGRRMAEVLVKQLTGGDAITARRMREDPWSFDPTHKLFLAANHKPEIRGTDRAIWRRIRLIPFIVSFEGRADKEMSAKLADERPGILAWLVRGAAEWATFGLQDPREVLAATETYREEMDPLRDFLTECCVTGSDHFRVKARELFNAYAKYRREVEAEVMSETLFARRMAERGFRKDETSECRWWIGVALKAPHGAE